MDQELDRLGPNEDPEFEAFLDEVFKHEPEFEAAHAAYLLRYEAEAA